MKIGFIGLGKMGSRMVQKLLNDGHEVFAWNRTYEDAEELRIKNHELRITRTIGELVKSMEKPRIIWLMVPAVAVDKVLQEVSKFVQNGDIIIDGGNSKYQDTEERYQKFTKLGIHFLGIGTSGGIIAQNYGYPFMVGGSEKGYKQIIPILDSLSKPNGGYEYFGEGGAGHFVKMVHNGIEYPIMQGLGEGFGIMAASKYKLNLLKVAKLYQKGTLVSGFMLDRVADCLENDPKLLHIAGVIGSASGEALWTVEEAKRLDQPAESITQAIDFRKRSETDSKVQNSFAAKLVAALRVAFGGHSVRQAQDKNVKRK